jgi:signal transduction histidine kinase
MAHQLEPVVKNATALVTSSSRRSEDRIRSLSEKLLKAEGEEFYSLAAELRAAISKHIDGVRTKLAEYPAPHHRRRSFDYCFQCIERRENI